MRVMLVNTRTSGTEDNMIPEQRQRNEEADAEFVKPADWPFMEQSGKVLKNIPGTWKQYPQNEAGMDAIIDMEYRELKAATTEEEKMHELVHLASACLHKWRHLAHVE